MDSLFGLLNLLVMPFWLLMIFAPRWRITARIMESTAVLVAPACAYTFLLLPQIGHVFPIVANPDLPRVTALLGVPSSAIVGWVHFLAFDLFVGRWIYLESRRLSLSHLAISPVLALTLLFGPMGLLAFLAIRGIASRESLPTPSSEQMGRASSLPEGQVEGSLLATATSILAGNRPLAFTVWFNAGLTVVALLGLAVDHRLVTGMSLWMKPLKFGISTGMYAFTLACLLTFVPRRAQRGGPGKDRFVPVVSWTSSILLTYEVAAIAMQAARGTTSHFNVAAPFDAAVFGLMGIAIAIVTILQAAVIVALLRAPLAHRPLALALRLGAGITLLGMLAAIPMVIPHADQIASAQAGHGLLVAGGHTAGGADGGPGLPVTGWSVRHGDWRIAHFWGLHALQVLPLFALLLGRTRRSFSGGAQTRLVAIVAAAYMAVLALLFSQAARGESVIHPGSATITIAMTIAVVTLIAGGLTVARQKTQAASLPA